MALTDTQMTTIEKEIEEQEAKATLAYKHKNARKELSASLAGIQSEIEKAVKEMEKRIKILDDKSGETSNLTIQAMQEAIQPYKNFLTAINIDDTNKIAVYGKRTITI